MKKYIRIYINHNYYTIRKRKKKRIIMDIYNHKQRGVRKLKKENFKMLQKVQK